MSLTSAEMGPEISSSQARVVQLWDRVSYWILYRVLDEEQERVQRKVPSTVYPSRERLWALTWPQLRVKQMFGPWLPSLPSVQLEQAAASLCAT